MSLVYLETNKCNFKQKPLQDLWRQSLYLETNEYNFKQPRSRTYGENKFLKRLGAINCSPTKVHAFAMADNYLVALQ